MDLTFGIIHLAHVIEYDELPSHMHTLSPNAYRNPLISQSGDTPLFQAATSIWGKDDVMEVLIKAGADVNARNQVRAMAGYM